MLFSHLANFADLAQTALNAARFGSAIVAMPLTNFCIPPESNIQTTILGSVVQSIVSLTSSLRGQLVKCFTNL